jgi:hypothetical protein
MKKYFFTLGICLVASFIISGCSSTKPYYEKTQLNWKNSKPPDSVKLKYSVFLVGDVGNPDKVRQEPTLKLLQQKIYHMDTLASSDTTFVNNSHPEDVVIFLGDNIYETGMPKPDAADRKEKERRITEQMKVVKDFKGKTIFVPGNHDWNESFPGGLAAVLREEEFVEKYMGDKDVFLPSNGCPGPIEVQLNKDLVVIVLDTEWWLYRWEKPIAPDNGCTAGSRLEIIQQIEDILLRNRGKNIVFAEHHPLFSNGMHGGYYTMKDYLFPLTLVRDNWYIPLPVIGAIYPLMRQYGVSREDLSNKDYQQFKRGLLTALAEEKNVVIATGHEHALQYNKYGDINHITSGAGSKSNPLIKGNGALFAHGTKGIARLNYYNNGQCWLEFWEPDGDGTKGTLVYRSQLYSIPTNKATAIKEEKLLNYTDSTRVIAASDKYNAGKLQRSLFGEHYRDTWAVPVKVNYLDMGTFAGGLVPLKMGGDLQNTALQFENKDGNVYQFRAINEDPIALLPESFLKTFSEDFSRNQISSAHPYGPLMIPDMAKALGIYYTDPKLVYMPNSPALGAYRQQVGGKLGFIEARPDEDVSDFKSFGNARNAISTRKLYEKLQDDNDNEVDQIMFLKSRLFDILIGDWDRQEDHWRWAEFKKEKGSLYRPIPRDRDQAFAKYDGNLNRLVSTLIPDFQSFDIKIKDVSKLSIASRNLDRNFLNELTHQQWQSIANEIKNKLTDDIITTAVHRMPKEVFNQSGNEIITKLKSRRDMLPQAAEEYYKTLAKEVTVTGTNKKEFFRVLRNEDKTELTIYKIDKNDKLDTITYHRIFLNSETTELNLFGLDGRDSLVIQGQDINKPIKIRIVGGPDKDFIADLSNSNKVFIYDSNGNVIEPNKNTKLILTDQDWVNIYDPNWFQYDKKGFVPFMVYNADDKLFIGGGYRVRHYGFRKEPASYIQSFIADYAPHTGAYVIKYQGEFYNLLKRNQDLLFYASYNGPKYTFSYYGQGNSTPNIDDPNLYYKVRTNNLSLSSFLQYRFNKAFRTGIGPGYEYYRTEKPTQRYVSSNLFPESADIAQPSRYGTIRSYADLDYVNNELFPSTGVRWRGEANYFHEIWDSKHNFLQLKSDISLYATPNFSFPVTAAIRFGSATNIGGYKFFQANSLGGNSNLRGYRNNRFSGRTYFYQNSELRFKVSTFRNYIFTGDFGVIGFLDAGRVYADVPESSKWHAGYGPGIWTNFYNKLLFSTGYGMSKEGGYLFLKLGLPY